jgi:hypothetical protein
MLTSVASVGFDVEDEPDCPQGPRPLGTVRMLQVSLSRLTLSVRVRLESLTYVVAAGLGLPRSGLAPVHGNRPDRVE